ncbi:unnamed protein product [Cylicocyclus nassatus]|uniref:Lipid-binding serum glycoprotein C-terminal domain-containing protein n=1 Tax=Cylicocyclus nassatus TaxID=53992 RepID=A0AA36GDG3_CYLNA|nr:unnamed protein product [Cylicocyclus nassatus]
MRRLLISITIWCLLDTTEGQVPKPAIRVRLNKGVFEQASTIVAGLVEYEVPRIKVPPTQQCFTEGCVQIHSFHMTSFRQPASTTMGPHPPNQFVIRVTDFDFFVMGQLGGTITVLIQLPVAGTVHITGMRVSVAAFFDIQKSVNDEPYMRMLNCQIDGGIIETRVANMGLITETVNTKYREAMSAQSKRQLEEAICENMYRLTQQHFSSRISKLPPQISVHTLLKTFLSTDEKLEVTPQPVRQKRASSDDYYDDIEKTEKKPTINRGSSNGSPIDRSRPLGAAQKITFTSRDVNRFFNVDRLRHMMIDLTLLDASATREDFTVGMSGRLSSTKIGDGSPFHVPFPFRVPQNHNRRMAEIVISEYSVNSMLYFAHRTNSLLFHVDSHSPGVGSLLKTTCTADEVCLSDQVEEVGREYPGQSLELIIRTTSPPIMAFRKDVVKLYMEGRCLFFLEGTRQKVGVIPFTTEVELFLQTVGNHLKGRVSIGRLTFNNGIEFFKLTADDLDGLRKTTKTALENMANAILNAGIPLSNSSPNSPLRLSAVHVSVQSGVVLLQANVDLYSSFYNHN